MLLPRSFVLMLGPILALAVPILAQPDSPELMNSSDHLRRYLAAVETGDLEEAVRHWRPVDVTAAARLGVRYSDQLLKVDLSSPLWRLVVALNTGEATCTTTPPVRITDGRLAGTIGQVLLVQYGREQVEFPYYFTPVADQWLLTSTVRLVAEQAPAAPGRFVEIYDRRPETSPNVPEVQVAPLDSCLIAMATRLGVGPGPMARLEREKFGYLLASPADVELLAGAPTVGVANLEQDVVVTSHPCHAHELAHLLLNFWLEELPLFTLPLLQEGAATCLGGRWGRHPRVLDHLGRTVLTDGFVSLDQLLTRRDFHAQSADLTYAPAGVFFCFLLDRYGSDGVRRAYLAGSGTAAEVSTWDAEMVMERLAGALATSWDDLAATFASYVTEPAQIAIAPGGFPGPWSVVTFSARGERLRLSGIDDLDRTAVVFRVGADAGVAAGAVLFGGGAAAGQPNNLFTEHFPDREYHGESHGLLFSPQEVKLYDYRRQMLIGLHAQGFWPSEEFTDEAEGTLRFRVRKDLLPAGAWVLVEAVH